MSKSKSIMVMFTLVFWLFGNLMGTHGHFCFDGQEPPMSVHMDIIGDHIEHHDANELHQDADINLMQSILAKFSKIDIGLVLLATLALIFLIFPSRIFTHSYFAFYPSVSHHWRPLLRAPPFIA
jgi:hypothetical protein